MAGQFWVICSVGYDRKCLQICASDFLHSHLRILFGQCTFAFDVMKLTVSFQDQVQQFGSGLLAILKANLSKAIQKRLANESE